MTYLFHQSGRSSSSSFVLQPEFPHHPAATVFLIFLKYSILFFLFFFCNQILRLRGLVAQGLMLWNNVHAKTPHTDKCKAVGWPSKTSADANDAE